VKVPEWSAMEMLSLLSAAVGGKRVETWGQFLVLHPEKGNMPGLGYIFPCYLLTRG